MKAGANEVFVSAATDTTCSRGPSVLSQGSIQSLVLTLFPAKETSLVTLPPDLV